MAYSQGAVVVAEDPFGTAPRRPYLVVSNGRTPFHGEEYIAAAVTTTARDEAIELTDERFERGELSRRSYVSPWAVVTLKDRMITKQPAETTTGVVDEIRQAVDAYLRTQAR